MSLRIIRKHARCLARFYPRKAVAMATGVEIDSRSHRNPELCPWDHVPFSRERARLRRCRFVRILALFVCSFTSHDVPHSSYQTQLTLNIYVDDTTHKFVKWWQAGCKLIRHFHKKIVTVNSTWRLKFNLKWNRSW